jgi:hypothetical protein
MGVFWQKLTPLWEYEMAHSAIKIGLSAMYTVVDMGVI